MKNFEVFIGDIVCDKKNVFALKEFLQWCQYYGIDVYINADDEGKMEILFAEYNIDYPEFLSFEDFKKKMIFSDKESVLIENNQTGLEDKASVIFINENVVDEVIEDILKKSKASIYKFNNFNYIKEILYAIYLVNNA